MLTNWYGSKIKGPAWVNLEETQQQHFINLLAQYLQSVLHDTKLVLVDTLYICNHV